MVTANSFRNSQEKMVPGYCSGFQIKKNVHDNRKKTDVPVALPRPYDAPIAMTL